MLPGQKLDAVVHLICFPYLGVTELSCQLPHVQIGSLVQRLAL